MHKRTWANLNAPFHLKKSIWSLKYYLDLEQTVNFDYALGDVHLNTV